MDTKTNFVYVVLYEHADVMYIGSVLESAIAYAVTMNLKNYTILEWLPDAMDHGAHVMFNSLNMPLTKKSILRALSFILLQFMQKDE